VAVLLALCCCLSAAHSQWCEKTLLLPDTFGGLKSPGCLTYDSANNTIYVGGGNCVLAIDGTTNQKIARIPAGSPAVLCYNPTNNKVYCANLYSNNVTVIDGATNGVLATVVTGGGPAALCYNPTDNKVYSANSGSNDATVIDGATDSVVATVAAGNAPRALCYDSTYNRVYCANDSSDDITVIDGSTDSVIATIGVGAGPSALAWNPVQNRVYVANYGGSSISVLRDSGGVGIEEYYEPRAESPRPAPTFVRGILFLPRDMTELPGNSDRVPRLSLMDAAGRKIMALLSGANDVRELAPGVYFVREDPQAANAKSQAIRKVVLAR
jgi:YVTN family beta-propeller protein